LGESLVEQLDARREQGKKWYHGARERREGGGDEIRISHLAGERTGLRLRHRELSGGKERKKGQTPKKKKKRARDGKAKSSCGRGDRSRPYSTRKERRGSRRRKNAARKNVSAHPQEKKKRSVSGSKRREGEESSLPSESESGKFTSRQKGKRKKVRSPCDRKKEGEIFPAETVYKNSPLIGKKCSNEGKKKRRGGGKEGEPFCPS